MDSALSFTRPADPVIKIRELAYVRFRKPDLATTERYLLDFGLHPSARTTDGIYMRGTGPVHHLYTAEKGTRSEFLGLGFLAADRSDLELVRTVPGASAVHESPEPGGGARVVLRDPSGFRVDVVWGMQELPELPMRPPLPVTPLAARRG